MKVFVFTFLLVAVGVHSLPQQYFDDGHSTREERIVTGNIKKAIERLAKSIREAGLDPLVIESFTFEASPVPILVTINAFIENLRFTGLSNIAINRMDYGALTNRLRFDVSLPKLELYVGDSGIRANVFGNRVTAQFRGKLAITQIRLIGDIRVNIGIISGISLRSVAINFRIEKIESALALIVQGEDYSDELNIVLNKIIPGLLEEYREVIDKFLSDLVLRVGNEALDRNMITEDQVLIA